MTQTSSAPQGLPPFPLLALNLTSLIAIAKRCKPAWTAHSVKQYLVLIATKKSMSSYALLASQASNVGRATVFVSHAWSYRFHELVAALERWVKATKNSDGELRDPDTTYCWVDLFSVNQHTSSTMPQEWWSRVFVEGIRAAGEVVLVMLSWRNAIPLTRVWCLWEIFHVTQAQVRFSVAMAQDAEDRLRDALFSDPEAINPSLWKVDCKSSQASKIEDKEMILGAIGDPGRGTLVTPLI